MEAGGGCGRAPPHSHLAPLPPPHMGWGGGGEGAANSQTLPNGVGFHGNQGARRKGAFRSAVPPEHPTGPRVSTDAHLTPWTPICLLWGDSWNTHEHSPSLCAQSMSAARVPPGAGVGSPKQESPVRCIHTAAHVFQPMKPHQYAAPPGPTNPSRLLEPEGLSSYSPQRARDRVS